MARQCLGEDLEQQVLIAPVLRGRRSESEALLTFLSQAHVRGVEVDWGALFKERGARQVDLPTYAFQRERYWLQPGSGATDARSVGLGASDHPLLSAAMQLAGDAGWLFTGRLSLQDHPWLKDHAVEDTVLWPGSGFLELALAAGQRVGAEFVEELTFDEPLVLDGRSAVHLQITVAQPDDRDRREINIHSRPEGSALEQDDERQWTRHAAGVLAREEVRLDMPTLSARQEWPPAGAERMDIEFLYDRLTEVGYGYGPAFQGLRMAWRRGNDLFAEVELDEEQTQQAGGFVVHPALLDAAFHAALHEALAGHGAELEAPFVFKGVKLCVAGASSLRVHLSVSGNRQLSLVASDQTGADVLSIEAMITRAIDAKSLRNVRRAATGSLFHIDWVQASLDAPNGSQPRVWVLGHDTAVWAASVEVERFADLAAVREALEGGAQAPELVITSVGPPELVLTSVRRPGGELLNDVHGCTERTLALVHEWLEAERLTHARLVLVTDGAMTVGPGAAPDLAKAAVWGLLRSAQLEHPGRFVLVDMDDSEASRALLGGVLLGEESQVALRDGVAFVPRLARVGSTERGSAPALDPNGTVLITGGTGGLGVLLARHLAVEHGARRLLLVSRHGPDAEGARELQAQLERLGCETLIVACDVADRAALETLLAEIPREHPLTSVIHCAAVLDNGVVEALDGERLARVMAAKVDGALHLHELTTGLELAQFVLCSSIAATLGAAGQANHAAANSVLDALASNRHAEGLPCISLAFGEWDGATRITEAPLESDRGRVDEGFRRYEGLTPMSAEQGLELFDAACASDRPLLAPLYLDTDALRSHAANGTLHPLLRGLIKVPTRRASNTQGALARRLAEASESEREAIVLELVQAQVAVVLGHSSAYTVDVNRPFKEAGSDSLTALDLRNRLSSATGLRLPATLVFDHPTPTAVAQYMLEVFGSDGERGGSVGSLDREFAEIEGRLSMFAASESERPQVLARLQALLSKLSNESQGRDDSDISAAGSDELFRLIDEELGRPHA